MAMSDKIAAFLASTRKKNNQQTASNTTTIYGYAASDSANGQVEVYIPGADVIQADNADNTTGNTVTVPIIGQANEGDPITILGVGNGIADTPIVLGGAGFGDRLRGIISNVATEAQNAIDAINQHFWHDDNGIHVTTGENDATTGPNLLANSIGVLLRNGTMVMSAQTPSGFTVYDGNGNTASNVIASFGANCVIGSIEGQHMLISDDEMTLLIPTWEEYETPTYVYKTAFHVGYVTEEVTEGGVTYVKRYPYYDLGERSAGYGIGQNSTTIGRGLIADQNGQIVLGKFNAQSTAVFVIGNGADDSNRANLLTLNAHGWLYCTSVYVTNVNATDGTFTGTVSVTGAITGASLTTTGNISGADITASGDLSVGGDSTVAGDETVTGTMEAAVVKKDGRNMLAYDVLYDNANGSWSGDLILANRTIFDGGNTGYKRVDILFKDSDGNHGSLTMWNPKNLEEFTLTTSYFWGTGFSTKSRAMYIGNSNKFMDQNYYPTNSNTPTPQNGQLLVDSLGTRYNNGSYIGITAVIGYK